MMFEKILFSTIPIFLVVFVGFLAQRAKIISEETESSIMQLVLWVLYPSFVLQKIPGNSNLKDPFLVGTTIAIGAGVVLTGIFICWFVGKLMKIPKSEGLNTFMIASGIQNYGFIPIPLIAALFAKEEADRILGVLFVHSLGIEIVVWTAAVVIVSGSSSGAWKRLFNGPTIAIVLGLFLNFSGWYTFIPDFIGKPIDMLAPCAIPIGLLLVGASIGGVLEKEKWKFDWRVMGSGLALRFAILPMLFLLVACAVPFSRELQILLLVQAAMPSAVTPILLARHFGGHPRVALQVCLTTSLASFVLTPLVLTLAFWLMGINLEGFTEPPLPPS